MMIGPVKLWEYIERNARLVKGVTLLKKNFHGISKFIDRAITEQIDVFNFLEVSPP